MVNLQMFIQDMGIGKLLVTIGAAALLMLLEVFLGLRSIPIALMTYFTGVETRIKMRDKVATISSFHLISSSAHRTFEPIVQNTLLSVALVFILVTRNMASARSPVD